MSSVEWKISHRRGEQKCDTGKSDSTILVPRMENGQSSPRRSLEVYVSRSDNWYEVRDLINDK